MSKAGIFHDYDLHANLEPAAQQTNPCAVCDEPQPRYQWSDYHGEAMCCRCGCPYQLKGGGEELEKEGKYPYLSLREDFVPVAREFWERHKLFVHYGASFSRHDGKRELDEFIREKHPELLRNANGNE